jgi:hypothetical protein
MSKRRRASFEDWREQHQRRLQVAESLAFVCAICDRRVVPEVHHISGQLSGRDRNVPPLCKRCEHGMGKTTGYNTSARSIPHIGHGSFMDRRVASQIAALTEALEVEANQVIWKEHYAKRASNGA